MEYWPPQERSAPNVSKIISKINKDPELCCLHELNLLQRKICISVRLSDVISAAVSVNNSTSFIISWNLPSVLAPHVITSINTVEEDFFLTEKIESLLVGDVKVYLGIKLDKTLLVVATHPKESTIRDVS